MNRIKKLIDYAGVLTVFTSLGMGIYQASHDQEHLIQNVEVDSSDSFRPLDKEGIIKLAEPVLASSTLRGLSLASVKQRVMLSEWIEDVRLEKNFLNNSLLINVMYHKPVAIAQLSRGGLAYVSNDGKIFGSLDLVHAPDLPTMSGLILANSDRLHRGLKILKSWENSSISNLASISTISWDPGRGYRVLVSYSAQDLKRTDILNSVTYFRTMIDLGNEVDAHLESKFLRLENVLRYLGKNFIAVRQVWADAEKKVIVKTVHGS